MRWLSFVLADSNQGDPPAALMEAMGPFMEKAFKAGTLIDTGGMAPPEAAKRVRLTGGQARVTDGPFSETKELVGGWAIMKFATEEEAIQSAKEFLELHAKYWPEWKGQCELRQIFGPND